jgi:hypothetical protein
MENPDTDDSGAIIEQNEQDRLEDLEQRLKTHEKILRDFSIIGPGMSGNVDDGWDHNLGPGTTSSD